MGKIKFTYDPVAQAYANKISAQADKISNLAGGYDTHSQLTDLGKSELSKISSGRMGDTMIAGVARNAAARDIQSAKDDMTLGTAAMRTGANNPNSLISNDRAVRRRTNETRNRAADFLAQAAPGYASEVGGWANTDNDLLSQRINAESGATSALSTAAGVSSAGTVAQEKKGFWGGLLSGLSSVASIAGSAASMGLKFSDKRTKEKISKTSDKESAAKILKMNVRKFKYKPEFEDGGEHTGVVAQEVEKVSPEAVKQGADGLKRVDYASLFATNIGATKDLISRVEKLEKADKKGKK